MKLFFKRVLFVAAIVIMVAACVKNQATSTAQQEPSAIASSATSAAPSPNVLLLIADDLGIDALNAYQISKTPPRTPNLDALAAKGGVFDNFWVTPACTTTRGALITGQHGFESTVDYVPAVLPAQSQTLQQRLKANDSIDRSSF